MKQRRSLCYALGPDHMYELMTANAVGLNCQRIGA